MNDVRVILTTTSSEQEALALSRGLVQNRLAACVQRLRMASVYEWEGEMEEAEEMLLLIKTTAGRYQAIEAWIIERHSYQVPEILMLTSAKGSSRYQEWVSRATRPA